MPHFHLLSSPLPIQWKRESFIDNDIVVIIFVDHDTDPQYAYKSAIMDFDPKCMWPHFNYIFALVTYDPVTKSYHLVVYTEENVPLFGPRLPSRAVFTDFATFRNFLLAKCKDDVIF